MGRFIKLRHLLLAAGLAILPIAVLAVHDLNLLELDRNAADDPTLGDDWANIYLGTDSALGSVFTGRNGEEMPANDTTYFTGGGSKDVNDVSEWNWTATDQTPDKDDILNAYAAAYLDPNGELILYFGADRLANNGDSQIGFWFFRNSIDLDPNGSFSGVHSIGDILVLSDFTQGGNINTITVYEWVGGSSPLYMVATGADCVGPPPPLGNDNVCATVNNGDTPSPWPYKPKFGTIDTFPAGSFYEGGVNLGALGVPIDCFSSFLAETRSSQSETAQLKDFTLGNFNLCTLAVTKDGDTLSKVGDDITYDFEICNTGALTLNLDSVTDVGDGWPGLGDLTSTADGAGCDPLASTECCSFSVPYTVMSMDPDPLNNTVTVVYNSQPDFTGQSVSAQDDHSVELFQPCVTLGKVADTSLTKVGDPINYTITVDNCSSTDSPDLDCTVTDPLTGVNEMMTLASGGQHIIDTTYTVMAGDPDPLVNTANVTCSPVDFPNVLTDSDTVSVNLFQPSISFSKTGDTLSKVGDDVNYTITLNNTSSADTPALDCTITDAMLGIDESVSLDSGGQHVIHATYTVLAGDPDPLVNTASATCSPTGFPNVLTASASHSVNLFQPSIALAKTGDLLSKVGDDVNYMITLDNTSSADTPALDCTITDTMLGIDESVSLGSGGQHVIHATYTVMAGDPDPLVNTANVTCSPAGFPNVLTASASHSVNLFQPSITLTKTGDTLSKVGDGVNYMITLHNTSSADTPDLACTITDMMLGINVNVSLASGGQHVSNASYTVMAGDPDPLVNTASATCSPAGFPNVLTASASHSVNLFQPSIGLSKTCGPIEVAPGDTVSYAITFDNTSSADSPDLSCTITDPLLGVSQNVTVGAGGQYVINASRAVMVGDPNPLVNTASVTCSPAGFPNVLSVSDSCEVTIVGCALSPGFWKGGSGVTKWDSPTDPIAITAGFYTNTVFPWLAPRYAGTTYLGVMSLKTSGDVTVQLAFKYVAARLNQAAFGVPGGVDTLLDSIDVYFASNPVGSDPSGLSNDQGKALLTALNTYFATVGESFCPDPSTF